MIQKLRMREVGDVASPLRRPGTAIGGAREPRSILGMADALPVINARLPEFAEHCRDALEHGGDNAQPPRRCRGP